MTSPDMISCQCITYCTTLRYFTLSLRSLTLRICTSEKSTDLAAQSFTDYLFAADTMGLGYLHSLKHSELRKKLHSVTWQQGRSYTTQSCEEGPEDKELHAKDHKLQIMPSNSAMLQLYQRYMPLHAKADYHCTAQKRSASDLSSAATKAKPKPVKTKT